MNFQSDPASATIGQIRPIIFTIALQALVKSRNERIYGIEDAIWQERQDESIFQSFACLAEFPAERWLALCEGEGANSVLLAAFSYCSNFEWPCLFIKLVEAGIATTPFSEVGQAATFSRPYHVNENDRLHLSQIASAKLPPNAIAWLLATQPRCPVLDLNEVGFLALDDIVAQMLAWILTWDNFDSTMDPYFLAWAKRQGDVGFWASLGLIVRRVQYHDQVGVLLSRSGDDPIKQGVAQAMADAIKAGPLTPEEAKLQCHDYLFEGPRQHRLQRAFRLAAFLPGDVPVVDPNMPFPWQESLADRLRQELEKALTSGISFTPAAYADKARHIQAVKTEADERGKKLKERMAPRGWSESAITEALANGPGLPVLGYPYGSALLRFHPETRLPIVSCAETGEVIHIGRADYVYDIDKDAYQAIPEEQRPSLPVWREPSPSAADLTPLYVRLKNEWIDVWRPVDGRWVERNVYCLMPHDIPEDETQEFWIGHYVECTVRRFGAGVGQVATKLAERRW